MAKKTIRCKKCENRVVIFETGFTGYTTLVCSASGREVDSDDGCTFGIEGPSKFKCMQTHYTIDLGSDAIVRGWHE